MGILLYYIRCIRTICKSHVSNGMPFESGCVFHPSFRQPASNAYNMLERIGTHWNVSTNVIKYSKTLPYIIFSPIKWQIRCF